MFIDGRKQKMDEDIFDQMVEALHQPDIQEPPIPTSTRWKQPEAILTTSRSRYKPDGTYDKKPLDPDYFSKYYQKKLATPFQCPDCGRTISSKSNLSKHRQTNVCMRKKVLKCWTQTFSLTMIFNENVLFIIQVRLFDTVFWPLMYWNIVLRHYTLTKRTFIFFKVFL